MSLPFGVVDADGHLVEDHARIREYMEPPYNSYLLDNVPDKKGRVAHGGALTNTGPPDSTMGRFGSVGPYGISLPPGLAGDAGKGRHGDDLPVPYHPVGL